MLTKEKKTEKEWIRRYKRTSDASFFDLKQWIDSADFFC